MLDYGQSKPFSQYTSKVEALEGEILTGAFSGKISVEEATKELQDRQNEVLQEK